MLNICQKFVYRFFNQTVDQLKFEISPQGDSGSGMQQINDRGLATVVGITSYGLKGCPPNQLARFTRVDCYVDEICQITGICYTIQNSTRFKLSAWKEKREIVVSILFLLFFFTWTYNFDLFRYVILLSRSFFLIRNLGLFFTRDCPCRLISVFTCFRTAKENQWIPFILFYFFLWWRDLPETLILPIAHGNTFFL